MVCVLISLFSSGKSSVLCNICETSDSEQSSVKSIDSYKDLRSIEEIFKFVEDDVKHLENDLN